MHIVFYKPTVLMMTDSQPPQLPEEGVNSIYSFENLPRCHYRKYIYASRFVQLVKAKTPKITLYTSHSKCFFMENGPHPDFEVHFYNGLMITQVRGTINIKDQGKQLSFTEGKTVTYEEYYKYCKHYYEKCLLLESSLTSLETATGSSYFPTIIGRKPTFSLQDDSIFSRERNCTRNVNNGVHNGLNVYGATCPYDYNPI